MITKKYKEILLYPELNTEKVEDCFPKRIPSFMVEVMMTIHSLQPLILKTLWYLIDCSKGCESQIAELYSATCALNKSNETTAEIPIPSTTPILEQQKAEIRRYLMHSMKHIIIEHKDYKDEDVLTILQFLVKCATDFDDGKRTTDEVLYWLEDLVSPCFGVLEETGSDLIIKEVKLFIRTLH